MKRRSIRIRHQRREFSVEGVHPLGAIGLSSLAFVGDLRFDGTAVGWIRHSANQPISLQAVDQLSHVRPNAGEPRSQLAQRQRLAGAHQLAQDRELGSGKSRLTKRRFEARFEGVGRLEDGVEVFRLLTGDSVVHA